jgi:hypothetical protein
MMAAVINELSQLDYASITLKIDSAAGLAIRAVGVALPPTVRQAD